MEDKTNFAMVYDDPDTGEQKTLHITGEEWFFTCCPVCGDSAEFKFDDFIEFTKENCLFSTQIYCERHSKDILETL